jgi:hypothetical protein
MVVAGAQLAFSVSVSTFYKIKEKIMEDKNINNKKKNASESSDTGSGTSSIKKEQCPKEHALCEGQCSLDKGHSGKHECSECGLYFG